MIMRVSICMVECVCAGGVVYACITFVPADKSINLTFVNACHFTHANVCLWSRPSLFASEFHCFKSYIQPLACSTSWPAALYQQLVHTAFPRLPPQSLALYHAWHTAGLVQAQNTSSMQPAERSRDRLEDGLRGSRRPLLGWDIP